jgi:gas vesicle protein
MKEDPKIIEVRGFGFGQVMLAALAGAAAGAAFAYLTAPAAGTESRRRMRQAVAGTKEGIERVPVALARATEAARDAFVAALDQNHAAG